MKHFRVFGCPAVFKRYEVSDNGKRVNNKYTQKGMRGIFVGLLDDSTGWIFYVPLARCSYISLNAIFDEPFTSPIALLDLPYQGTLRLRNISIQSPNQETLTEHTSEPICEL